MDIIEYLRILGFNPEFGKGQEINIADIKKRYKELVLQYHPDKLGEVY
jgi:curved DNA-binding protein CbpA